jgi:hypothetical protein
MMDKEMRKGGPGIALKEGTKEQRSEQSKGLPVLQFLNARHPE